VHHADVVEQRGVPVARCRVLAAHRQVEAALVDRDPVLGSGDERQHVHGVHPEYVDPGCRGRLLGGDEVRPRLLRVAGRAEQPAPFEGDPGRQLVVPDRELVEKRVPLVVPVLQAEGPGHLDEQHEPVAAFGDVGSRTAPLLGAGRVVEVPQVLEVRHGPILTQGLVSRSPPG